MRESGGGGKWCRKIRYGEMQASEGGLAIGALLSILAAAVDPSM